MLITLNALFHLIFATTYKVDAVFIPNLYMSKLRLTEVKSLPQGHVGDKLQSQGQTGFPRTLELPSYTLQVFCVIEDRIGSKL